MDLVLVSVRVNLHAVDQEAGRLRRGLVAELHGAGYELEGVLDPLVLELERPIHSMPVDIAEYDAQEFPLYRSAKREGVLL